MNRSRNGSIRVAFVLTFCLLILAPAIRSQNNLTDSMRNFDYEQATEMKGLSGYASKKMREYMSGDGGKKIDAWAQEAKQKWIEENGLNPAFSKKTFNTPLNGVKNLPWEAVPEYRDYLKSQISAKMQSDFPGMVETYMKDKVFQGAAIGSGIETEVQNIVGNVQNGIMSQMNGILDKTFSDWGSQVGSSLAKTGTADALGLKNIFSQNISSKMGVATKDGLKGFIDDEMFNVLGENFGEKLEGMMKQGADALDGLAGQLGDLGISGVSDLSGLAGQISNASGLQSIVDQAGGILSGSPLGNGLNLSPENYLGMTTQMFNEFKLSPPGVSLPRIEIPAPGYAGILAASAATHFSRAIKFMYVDMNEIRKGITLIKTMVWQLRKKQDSFMLVGGDVGGKSVFGSMTFEMTDERKQKLDEMLASAEALAAQEDGTAMRQGVAEVIQALDEFKKECDGMLNAGLNPGDDGATLALNEPPAATNGCSDPYGTGACQFTPVDGGSGQIGATEEALYADDKSPIDPMRMYSGEFELTATDVKVRGVGLDFELTRSYGSQQERVGDLGYNWSHNYEEKLVLAKDTQDVLWQIADGRRYWFRFDVKTGLYLSPRGHFKTLAREDNKFVIRDGNGLLRIFNEEGFLIEIRDRFANSLKFQYGLIGQSLKLARVQDTLGRFFDFRYSKEGLLESVLDPFGREVRYNYDAEQNLVSVRTPTTTEFPEGTLTRYSYSGGNLDPVLNHNITMIMDPKGQIYLKNSYGTAGETKDRLVAQRYGDKVVAEMKIEYEFKKNPKKGINDVQSLTRVFDRKGHKHEYEYNAIGLRLSYVQNDKKQEVSKYNSDGQLVEFKDASGIVTTYVYNEKSVDPRYRGLLLETSAAGTTENALITRYVYDAKNSYRLTAKRVMTGPHVREQSFEYNAAGELAKMSGAAGSLEYLYDDKGRVLEEKTGGKIVRYVFNGADVVRIDQIGDEQTRSITLGYDAYGNINLVIDPLGNITKSYFNAYHLLVKQEDALGTTTYFRYDANKNLVETTTENSGGYNADVIGMTLGEKYDYDELDNLVRKQIQVSRDVWVTETYTYDANENLITKTDWRGQKFEYVYDDFDRVIEEKSNGETKVVFSLNDAGLPISIKNALGEETLYHRDGWQRVQGVVDAMKNRREMIYNGFGELEGSKFYEAPIPGGQANEILRQEILFERDGAGRVVVAKTRNLDDPSGQSWWRRYWLYDGADLKEIKDDLGTISRYEYDAFGELIRQIRMDGTVETLDYNALGLPVKRKVLTEALDSQLASTAFEETYAYDALNRPIRKTDADGNSVSREYDSVGNLIALIDELGQKTTFEYDGLSRLLREKRQDRVRELLWDAQGNLVAVKDALGQTSTFSYDDAHRLIAEEGFDGIKTSYTYDKLDRMLSQNVSGRTYAYEYDKLGRLIKKTSAGYVQTFGYDALGRLVQSFDGNDPQNATDDVTASYAYNALDFVENQTLLAGTRKYETRKFVDVRGQTRKMQYPSGEIVNWQYADSGRMTSVQTGTLTLSQYEYTPLGQVRKEQLGNGVAQVLEYDKLLRLAHQSYMQDQKTLSDFRYGYDKKDRLIASEDGLAKTTTVYGYNVYDQLVQVGEANVMGGKSSKNKGLGWDQIWQASQNSRSYEYSLEGEWKNVIVKEQKQKTQTTIATGKGYRYEKIGDENVTFDAYGNLTGKGDTSYEYDAWNRLIAIKRAGELQATYSYDAQNRRVSKATGGETTTYVYDGWTLIEEYQDNQATKKYYAGRGVDQYVGYFANNQNYYYHRDRLGSVVAVSDAAGAIVAQYDYDEYGKIKTDTGSLAANSVTYTGQYYDTESDLYYYKNRYYDAEIGRFLSQDPEGFVDGPNVYAYVGNDPMNFVDPLGRYEIKIGAFGSGGHEKITDIAEKNNGISATNFYDPWYAVKSGLTYGVKVNDLGEADYKTFKATHHGGLQYWHSMSNGGETNQQTLERIIAQAKEWYGIAKCAYKTALGIEKSENVYLNRFMRGELMERAGIYLGRLLHMIQDSYPSGHTLRNDKGVLYFQNYNLQEGNSAHKKADKLLSGDLYEQAVSASTQIIGMWKDESENWSKVEDFLRNKVYNLQDPSGQSGRVVPGYETPPPQILSFPQPQFDPDTFIFIM